MKPSELRTGNLVKYEQITHFIVELRQFHVVSSWIKDPEMIDKYYCEYKFIKSITLTEEWLVKFGFKVNKLKWELNGFVIIQRTNNTFLYETTIIDEVHHLQNLFYDIKRYELKIKQND